MQSRVRTSEPPRDCRGDEKRWNRNVKLVAVVLLCIIGGTLVPVVIATDSTVRLQVAMDFTADPFLVPAYGPTGLVNLSVGGAGGIWGYLFPNATGGSSIKWAMASIDMRIDENVALLPKRDVVQAVVFGRDNYVRQQYIESPSLSMSFGGFGEMRKYFLLVGGTGCPIPGAEVKAKVPKGYLFSYLKINVVHEFAAPDDYLFDVNFWAFGQDFGSQEFGLATKVVVIKRLMFNETLYPEWYDWWVNKSTVVPPVSSPYRLDVTVNDVLSLTDLFSREVSPWYERIEEGFF